MECCHRIGGLARRPAAEKPNYRHRRLLPASRERPRGCRAAEQRDEPASPHGAHPTGLDWITDVRRNKKRRLRKNFLSCCSIGRVRSCVRPVLCGGEAAGHNALRGSGPNQKHAFKDALTQTGSPDPGSTLSALRRHVLANSFKLQTPSSFPGLTSLNRSGF